MMQSGLDSTNAFEFGGFRVKKDTFMHKTGLVGMSSAGITPESIRFWSGHVDPLQASFRVTQAGILTAVSAFIMSALGYPRLELNSGGNLFAAYKTATDLIKMVPDFLGSPAYIFDNGPISGSIGNTPTKFLIQGISGIMRISANNDMEISSGGKVKFDAWSNILNGASNRTLQQDLDAITNSIPSGTYAVITYSGGVATSGRSLTASDIPSGISPSKVATDASNRFVTDTEKATWNEKISGEVGTDSIVVAVAGSQAVKTISFVETYTVAPKVLVQLGGSAGSAGYINLIVPASQTSTTGFNIYGNSYAAQTLDFTWVAIRS